MLIIKNRAKFFAAVGAAVILFSMSSCATFEQIFKPTIITVTGIDSQYNGMYAIAGLSKASGNTVAAGMPQRIIGRRITWEMLKKSGRGAPVMGRHSVIIRVSESSLMNEQTVFVYDGAAVQQKISWGNNTISFDKFVRADQ